MKYNLNREEAAKMLWISTRTLDRWIRKWKLSHSKDVNKIMLSEEEIKNIWKDINQISNIVIEWQTKTSFNQSITQNIDDIVKKLWKQVNENMLWFLEVLAEKDKKIEEKNQIIFAFQQKISEIEIKLKNSIALPQYEAEKKEVLLEKENLKYENKILEENIKKEKIQNIFLTWIIVIFVIILIIVVSV